jgi:glycosyltransferase involved in cell wall biosynthesis
MDKRLNICLVSREFPPDTAFGGIATYSLDIARIIKAYGHKVTVFSQSPTSTYFTTIRDIPVHKIKIPRVFMNYRQAFLPVFILAYNAAILWHVWKQHRQYPFDLIDVPDHLAEGLFTFLLPDVPVVTRLHTPYSLLVEMGLNNYRKDLSFWLIKQFEKAALRRSDVLYAPTRDLVQRCDRLLKIGNIKVEIFGYPLDLDLFSPSTQTHPSNQVRILFLGRLEQRKGIETIAMAFPKVFARYPEVTLTMVGRDTPNIAGFSSGRKYLENHFVSKKCAHAVRFIDNVSLEQLPEIFRAHDIVWVPSLYDNFPLICLEAMACGKSVVVSDAGGLPEMVSHEKTGLVFHQGDPDDLAQKTLTLLSHPDLISKLGKNARLFCEQNYNDEFIYKKNTVLYQAALEARKK